MNNDTAFTHADTFEVSNAFQESIPDRLSGDSPEFRRACARYERRRVIASIMGCVKAAGTILAISFLIALCVIGTEDLSKLLFLTLAPLMYIGMCALSIAASFLFTGAPIYGICKLIVWLKDSRVGKWFVREWRGC